MTDSKMFPFADPANPTHEELRAFAYSDYMYVEEDSDIVWARPENMDLFLEFASDPACPARDFFQSCMRWHVRDALQEGRLSDPDFAAWFAKAKDSPDETVKSFCRDAELLLKGEMRADDFVS